MYSKNIYRVPIADAQSYRFTSDKHGILHNFHKTRIEVNEIVFTSSEALYQSLKLRNPFMQMDIANEATAKGSKLMAYQCKDMFCYEPWMNFSIDAMRYTLWEKVRQDTAFRDHLLGMADGPIVEESKHDPFWGARRQGDVFIGGNALGRLQRALRTYILAEGVTRTPESLSKLPFVINGLPV